MNHISSFETEVKKHLLKASGEICVQCQVWLILEGLWGLVAFWDTYAYLLPQVISIGD